LQAKKGLAAAGRQNDTALATLCPPCIKRSLLILAWFDPDGWREREIEIGLGAILVDPVVSFSIQDLLGAIVEQECAVVEREIHDQCSPERLPWRG
jgi:hypothetical protein